jgi:predicted ArsR family transcriptional regulator
MVEIIGVTATAVRQRLSRLMAQGHIERSTLRAGRGRPSHRYVLTELGQRQTGANFADLAIALWEEIRSIRDAEVRRGLLQRLASRVAASYATQVSGDSLREKMESICKLFGERDVPFAVEMKGQLPVLTALACPYPELAERDRSICSMERMMFSELLGENLSLTGCRLDGEQCCTFETNQSASV